MRSLIKSIIAFLNIIVGIGLIVSALTSNVDATTSPKLIIATMSFPVWIVLGIVFLIIDFFVLRKWCIWQSFCIAIGLPLAFTVLPLNIQRGKVPARLQADSWTLLTFNVYNFEDITWTYPGGINPTLSYILRTDADVVVLEEAEEMYPLEVYRMGKVQLDSIKERYPYSLTGHDVVLLSKFPAKAIEMKEFPSQRYKGSGGQSKIGAFIVDIHGQPTAIFGCHLRSLGLTRRDKDLYEDFTRGEGLTSKKELAEAKNDIITKIAKANKARAESINSLCSFIKDLNCENAIVCGDFNDTPGSYPLERLQEEGFREVYPLVGNGYMFTYNKDRLLFQIDHVLFRGDYRPWSMVRGDINTSDHYPLLTTFVRK